MKSNYHFSANNPQLPHRPPIFLPKCSITECVNMVVGIGPENTNADFASREQALVRSLRVAVVMSREGALVRGIVGGIAAIGGPQFWRLEWIPLDHLDRLARFNPDAIVYGSSELAPLVEKFKSKINVAVMADFSALGVPSFNVDDYQVGVLAAGHLLQRGLRSMAFFGPLTYPFSAARYQGFRDTVAEAGFECPQWWYSGKYRGPDSLDGTPEIYDWLRSLTKPTGFLCGCDSWACGLVNCCRGAGLRVPEQIAIVGVDNDELLCSLAHPPVSSVAVPWDHIGEAAALAVEEMFQGKKLKPALTLIKPAFVATRRSTDILAVEDDNVRMALDFIRASAGQSIKINDILRRVPVYRQRLFIDFHRVVGRTVMQEVRRVHVEQACRLIDTTNLSMTEVARRSGFNHYRRMGIAFRKELGQTPSAYRRESRVRSRQGA
jgi:LacI family transcriptional regulator